MNEKNRQFMTGADLVVQACEDAGAKMMYGYPITPTCEVLAGWIGRGNPYLETEDEIASGFGVCGAVMAGQKAFTASSGPGHILLQDGFSMAEGMRLPFVMIVGQRGGPSSGTVIYSQQEVTLACYGGNGEGMRLVYSPANLTELYELTRKAFNDSWQYRFPAVVLTDGYMLKIKAAVEWDKIKKTENVASYPLVPEGAAVHWPNIYTAEEELNAANLAALKDFNEMAPKVAAAEEYLVKDAEVLLIAHGIVAMVAKEAVDALREKGAKVGLFRPITLRPFPKEQLDKIVGQKSVKKVLVVESSLGHLERLVRGELDTMIARPFGHLQHPAMGVEKDDIIKFVSENKV